MPTMLTIVLLAATAVAGVDDLDAEEKRMLALLGDKVSVVPSEAKIDQATINPAVFKQGVGDYLVTHGPKAGSRLPLTVEFGGRAPATWPKSDRPPTIVTIPGREVLYLHRDADGRLLMPTQVDLEHSVLVSFTPGELFLPVGAVPPPYETKVRVWDLHDPTRLEHSGSLRIEARDRGVWKVETPAGTFECRLHRMDYTGKVGPAEISDTSLILTSPEVGLVARVEGKRVSAFLVYNTDTEFAFVLAERPSDPNSPRGE